MLNLQSKLSLAAACVAFGTLGLVNHANAQEAVEPGAAGAGGIVGVASFIVEVDTGFVVEVSAGSAIGATTAAGIAGTEVIQVDEGEDAIFDTETGEVAEVLDNPSELRSTTRALVLGTGADISATVVTANDILVPNVLGAEGDIDATGALYIELDTTGADSFNGGINNGLGQDSQTPLIPNLPNIEEVL